MKLKITAALVKAPPPIPPGVRKLRITDADLTGFILECWPTGGATFWLKYTDNSGRTREVKLGKASDLTVEQARRKAKELRARISLAGDPASERDRLRAIPLFADFVNERYLPYVRERLRSHRDHESFCRLRLFSAWAGRRLDEIRPADVVDLQQRLKADGLAPATINRYVALVRRIYNLALRWEVVTGRNPAQHADMLREQGRELFLVADQIRRLFQVLDVEKNRTAASCLALLSLTGARSGEALNLRWDDLDFSGRIWRVERSKSGRTRYIPLSDAAVAVLQQQPRYADCPWVFPNLRRDAPMEGLRRCWLRAKERAGLPDDLRIHDLRHSFASTLVNNGRPIYEVAEILGHSQLSTTRRYAHFQNERLVDAANIAGRIATVPVFDGAG